MCYVAGYNSSLGSDLHPARLPTFDSQVLSRTDSFSLLFSPSFPTTLYPPPLAIFPQSPLQNGPAWSWSCITLACKFLHTVWPFRTEVMGATGLQHPPFHPTRRHCSESSQAVTPPSSSHIPSRATLPATQTMHFG